MKKCCVVILVLCVCLSICACAASDPDNLFGTSTPSVQTETTSVVAPSVVDIPLDDEYYQYGNMQKNAPSGEFMLYGDSVLFADQVNHSYRILQYDLETGEVGLLCNDATCSHRLCPDSVRAKQIELYHGDIYISDMNKVYKLKDNTIETIVPGGISCFWHANENLYVKTQDGSLAVFENGSSKSKVLIDEITGAWDVVFERYLYTNSKGGYCRVDLYAEKPEVEVLVENCRGITDGEHIYYIDYSSNLFYRCDMDGSNAVQIGDGPVLPASLNFDDEYFYFRYFFDNNVIGSEGSHDLYRFPKADPTKIEKILTLDETVWEVFTVPGRNIIFVIAAEDAMDENGNPSHRIIYVVNNDGSNPRKLEFPEY